MNRRVFLKLSASIGAVAGMQSAHALHSAAGAYSNDDGMPDDVAPGWSMLPGGMVAQWGVSDYNGNVSYPFEFIDTPVLVVAHGEIVIENSTRNAKVSSHFMPWMAYGKVRT